MDTEVPVEGLDPPMMRADELDRLVAVELACACLLEHAERLDRLAAAAAAELRAA